MADTIYDIWAGDKLGRQEEAAELEAFLFRETEYLAGKNRKQGFVLGLDAPYGEGKSWFLERFAKQLAFNHPVARVDAWADDTGNEPLIALMAAVEDALEPYLKKKEIKDHWRRAKGSLIPVIGKTITAVAGKAVVRYAGEELGDHVRDILNDGGSSDTGASASTEAGEAALAEIDKLFDRLGERMLSDYRKRKKSTAIFKERLASVVQALPATTMHAPIYIIVDELDRCRPSYAIHMLEEIKHIFDVPGIVFVIALHGQQLERSIKAVYGADFESDDYLRRFFSRRYRLSRPSVLALAEELFNDIGVQTSQFAYPEFRYDGQIGYHTAAKLVATVLAAWKVNPRQIYAVMDCIRLFASSWRFKAPIELVLLLNAIVNFVSGRPERWQHGIPEYGEAIFKIWDTSKANPTLTAFTANQLVEVYIRSINVPLREFGNRAELSQPVAYVHNQLQREFMLEHQSRQTTGQNSVSIIGSYGERVERVSRFVMPPSPEVLRGAE
jgi:hypothetical protein